MTALAKDFDTHRKQNPRRMVGPIPMAASAKGYKGGMAIRDANGRATPATAAAGRHAIGVFYDQADNSDGSAGDIDAEIECGDHKMNNHDTETLVQADEGKPCWIYDDNPVGKFSATAGGIAGIVTEVASDGVYVSFEERDWTGYEDTTVESKEDADATVETGITEYTVDGADTSALPDGRYIGQIKRLIAVAAANSPSLVVTPVSLAGFTNITFDAVGETWVGRWDGSSWQTIAVGGAALA